MNQFQTVNLHFSCRDLKNKDLIGKSDPQVRLFQYERNQWVLVGKTEQIENNLNPNFQSPISIKYQMYITQYIKIEVYDIDVVGSESIGSIVTQMNNIIGAPMQSLTFKIQDKNGKTAGQLSVYAQIQKQSLQTARWKWSGQDIKDIEIFNKSDPFLRFLKPTALGTFVTTHQTEKIDNNLNPQFKIFEVDLNNFCDGLLSLPLKVECFDHQMNGKHRIIGEAWFSIEEIMNKKYEYTIIDPKKATPSGKLIVSDVNIKVEPPTFNDYIRGGEQLNCTVAIDFSKSNGLPNEYNSLHNITKKDLNLYEIALLQLCNVIMAFDYDGKVSMWGFGAEVKQQKNSKGVLSHCFPLTGDFKQDEVNGEDNMLGLYRQVIPTLQFSGPCKLNEIITRAKQRAQDAQKNYVYEVLFIFIAGEIEDLDQSIKTLAECARLPLSILIIGMGQGDYRKLKILDGDAGLVTSTGKPVERDIVQFVDFKKYNYDCNAVAQDILSEIPRQFLEYKRLVKMLPNPPLC